MGNKVLACGHQSTSLTGTTNEGETIQKGFGWCMGRTDLDGLRCINSKGLTLAWKS
jgi:hypothetical protein